MASSPPEVSPEARELVGRVITGTMAWAGPRATAADHSRFLKARDALLAHIAGLEARAEGEMLGYLVRAHKTNPPELQRGDGISAHADYEHIYRVGAIDRAKVEAVADRWRGMGYDDTQVIPLGRLPEAPTTEGET